VAPGSRIILQTAGAGGYGDPYDRDPQHVRQDVIEGFIGIARAKAAYGVVLDAKTYEIDQAATRAERKQKAGTEFQE
jgi:N-methylhydantoinase B